MYHVSLSGSSQGTGLPDDPISTIQGAIDLANDGVTGFLFSTKKIFLKKFI